MSTTPNRRQSDQRYQLRRTDEKGAHWHVVDTWDNERRCGSYLTHSGAYDAMMRLRDRVGNHGVYGQDADRSRRI